MKTKTFFILLIAIATSFIATSCGVGPAVKELKKYNNPASRYWIDFIKENGINAIDDDGDILLLTAVIENNLPLAKACIKSGANVNLYVNIKDPALVYAVRNGNPDMIRLLIKNKAVIKDENFDCIRMLVKYYDVSNDTIDAILSGVNKNMLDYSDKGIFYGLMIGFNQINPYLFEKLYEKGYKPSPTDYRKFIDIWYMYGNQEVEEISKKILVSCKNTEAAKRVNPVFNYTNSQYYTEKFDTTEERRFEFLKFQVENGAAIKASEKEFEKQFKSNESDFIEALKYFDNEDNLGYIFNLLKNSGDDNIKIDDYIKERLIIPCIYAKDYKKLEIVLNRFKEIGCDTKISDRTFDEPFREVYKESSHEEFEKYVSEIERIMGQNCKSSYFIDDNVVLNYVKEKCGLTSDFSEIARVYELYCEYGTYSFGGIEYSDIIEYSQILDSVIKEIDWFSSLGFFIEDGMLEWYKNRKDFFDAISLDEFKKTKQRETYRYYAD